MRMMRRKKCATIGLSPYIPLMNFGIWAVGSEVLDAAVVRTRQFRRVAVESSVRLCIHTRDNGDLQQRCNA
jgi:hypothetical protein